MSNAMLTKEANNSVKDMHGRMPIMVAEQNYNAWLYKGDTRVFNQYGPRLDSYKVGRDVNKPEINVASIIQSIS